jgi:multidrug transporter EmrE-like cation transporter
MTWILLFVAGIFEIGFALGVKYSEVSPASGRL